MTRNARRQLAVVLSLVLLAGSACAGDAPRGANDTAVRECDAAEGSVTDVKHEPPWRPHAGYRPWTDRDGCLLRIDVLAERPGPSHCGWENASVIITGWPIGSRYTTYDDSLEFVKDPDGVFGLPELADGFDPAAELPEAAVDSGFRREGRALWHVPGDETAIWLVSSTRTERWPAGRSPGCD